MSIAKLRQEYHRRVCEEIIKLNKDGETSYPNFADKGSRASRAIAWGIVERIKCPSNDERISGQSTGRLFEAITKDFLEKAFKLLHHLRPGKWHYSTQTSISGFDQYEHLAELEEIIEQNYELASALRADYIVKPDIVISRWPVSDKEVNARGAAVKPENSVAALTPLRSAKPEIQQATAEIENEDQMDELMMLIEGRRLRDISDLPFDLAT